MTEKPTTKGRIIALGIGFIALILLSEAILRITMPHWREFHSGHFINNIQLPERSSLSIGKPGFKGHFAQNNGDFRVHISINKFGLRNPEPVTEANGRIWVIGDSMTFGWGVEQGEIYSSVLARLIGQPTYNIASPGTNVCGYQTLLDRMPDKLKPRAVIIGLVLENDIYPYNCKAQAERDHHNLKASKGEKHDPLSIQNIKGLLRKHTALYNFMTVSLKRVYLIREALTMVGLVEPGHRYRQSLDEAKLNQALERTAIELDNLFRKLPESTPFVVLLAPGRFELKDGNPFYKKLRIGMTEKLQRQRIPVVDPFVHFTKLGLLGTHFAHDGHWSKVGHELAAKALADWFKDKGLTK